MKRTLVNIVMSLALILAPAGILAGNAWAASGCSPNSTPKGQVLQGLGQTGASCNDSGVTSAITAAVNILSLIVGIAAILMIISSGLKYITSGGESGKVANAKNSLIYAMIGVAIVALAQFLVHFVINTAKK